MPLRGHYGHGEKHGQHDYASQPWFGVPGKSEKALIIKEVVSENSDTHKMMQTGRSAMAIPSATAAPRANLQRALCSNRSRKKINATIASRMRLSKCPAPKKL